MDFDVHVGRTNMKIYPSDIQFIYTCCHFCIYVKYFSMALSCWHGTMFIRIKDPSGIVKQVLNFQCMSLCHHATIISLVIPALLEVSPIGFLSISCFSWRFKNPQNQSGPEIKTYMWV